MSLAPGERLGPYEIVAPLGAGGMGVVYRARDPRLGREIAIKVLPPDLVADAERLRRFEREARAASALDHPNIVAVHDVGTHDGRPYLVLELLNGRTLREEIREKGALPLRRALELAIQIASGLAAAHERGIVHRDLKPENVLVTPDGRAKILDFGLARWTPLSSDTPSELAQAPTVEQETDPGVVLGTVGYMSPEQARGQPADARSDLFALGCILYELLSGRRAFARDTAADTLSAILRDDPSGFATVASERQIPPVVELVVRRCLEKSSAERFQSARDLAFELELIGGSSATAVSQTRGANPIASRSLWLGAGVCLALLGTTLALRLAPGTGPPENERSLIRWTLPASTSEYSALLSSARPSPDGRRLAAIGLINGKAVLVVRSMSELDFRAVSGAPDPIGMAWSSDGRYLFFRAEDKLHRSDADGQRVEILCSGLTNGFVASVSPDGSVLGHSQTREGGIVLIRPEDCSTKLLIATNSSAGEQFLRHPAFLPDGQRFTYFVKLEKGGETRVASRDGTVLGVAHRGESKAEFAPPSALLFVRDGTLFATRVEPKSLHARGEPVPLADWVEESPDGGFSDFSAHRGDFLTFRDARSYSRIEKTSREGKRTLLASMESAGVSDISQDGRYLLVVARTSSRRNKELWLQEISTGRRERLTSDEFDDTGAIFLAGGRQIIYSRTRELETEFVFLDLEGSLPSRSLLRRRLIGLAVATPDNKYLLFTQYNASTAKPEVWQLPLSGGDSTKVIAEEGGQGWVSLSPDGRWLAYTSDFAGDLHVYLKPFGSKGRPTQVPTPNAKAAFWSRSGTELFLNIQRQADAITLAALEVRASNDSISFGSLRDLFEVDAASWCHHELLSGELLCSREELNRSNRVHVLENWDSLLAPEP